MSNLSRFIPFAVLLGLFLTGIFILQTWVHRQGERLKAEAVVQKQNQLEAALTLLPPVAQDWSATQWTRLGALLRAHVEPLTAGDGAAPAPTGMLRFTHYLPAAPAESPTTLQVTFELSPLLRLQQVHLRTWVLLLVLATITVLLLLAANAVWRPTVAPANPAAHRREMDSFTKLAQVSAVRDSDLSRERDARQRTEQDLALNQQLLNQALEEKINLGRELHDNTCQTLYAVSLTLESIRKHLVGNPAAEARLDSCITELRRLNQEARRHISLLEPAQVRREPLAAALRHTLASLTTGRGVQIDQRLDDDALALLPPQHAPEVTNLIREAVSNALRHAQASQITLRAEKDDDCIVIAVVDNGTGFTPPLPGSPRSGHGLANMQARAASLGGNVQLHSSPGKGTRILLTLPIASPP